MIDLDPSVKNGEPFYVKVRQEKHTETSNMGDDNPDDTDQANVLSVQSWSCSQFQFGNQKDLDSFANSSRIPIRNLRMSGSLSEVVINGVTLKQTAPLDLKSWESQLLQKRMQWQKMDSWIGAWPQSMWFYKL